MSDQILFRSTWNCGSRASPKPTHESAATTVRRRRGGGKQRVVEHSLIDAQKPESPQSAVPNLGGTLPSGGLSGTRTGSSARPVRLIGTAPFLKQGPRRGGTGLPAVPYCLGFESMNLSTPWPQSCPRPVFVRCSRLPPSPSSSLSFQLAHSRPLALATWSQNPYANNEPRLMVDANQRVPPPARTSASENSYPRERQLRRILPHFRRTIYRLRRRPNIGPSSPVGL